MNTDNLAQVLARHGLAGMAGGFGDQPEAKTHACRCDRRWVTAAEYAAHQAAMVLAHLTEERTMRIRSVWYRRRVTESEEA